MKPVRTLAILLLATLSLPTPARAAFDYYLHLDGIEGDVTARSYERWISVLSYGFGASATGGGSGGGSSSLDVSVSDLSFTKLLDAASPKIFEHLVEGKSIRSGQLDIVTAGDRPEAMFSYEFEDIVFTSVTHAGGAPGQPVESIAFNFDKIKLTAAKLDPKGGKLGEVSYSYDLPNAAPVPEPSTWAMLAVGLVTVGFAMRRGKARH
ncbi:MAG: type VI secretion system tube protein Hcp [Burkholderiales bacterium]|nr:type VI secretion system tube protein Hcp [Burkholderiales bacterium]